MYKSKLYQILIIMFILYIYGRFLFYNQSQYLLTRMPLILIIVPLFYCLIEVYNIIKLCFKITTVNKYYNKILKFIAHIYYTPLEKLGIAILQYRLSIVILKIMRHWLFHTIVGRKSCLCFSIMNFLLARYLLMLLLVFDVFYFSNIINYYKYIWFGLYILTMKGLLGLTRIYITKNLDDLATHVCTIPVSKRQYKIIPRYMMSKDSLEAYARNWHYNKQVLIILDTLIKIKTFRSYVFFQLLLLLIFIYSWVYLLIYAIL